MLAGLSGLLVEAPARELRLDDRVGGRLRVLDVDLEQAEPEVAYLARRPKHGPARGMERVEEKPEFERVACSPPLAGDRHVLFSVSERAPCITVVPQRGHEPIGHALVALRRYWLAAASSNSAKQRPKRARQNIAIIFRLEAQPMDHYMEQA